MKIYMGSLPLVLRWRMLSYAMNYFPCGRKESTDFYVADLNDRQSNQKRM
jgi:hypothetical protein